MANPWEKYQAASQPAGPWAKYSAPAAPPDPREAELPPRPGEETFDPTAKPISETDTFGDNLSRYGHRVNAAAAAENKTPDGGIVGLGDAALSLFTGALSPLTGAVRRTITGEPIEQAAANSTYAPRTEAGKAHVNLASELLSPLSESGADVALLPLMGGEHFGGERPPSIPSKAQPMSFDGIPKPPMPDYSQPLPAARAAGYKVLPSEADGGMITQMLEKVGGPGLKKDFRRANQEKTTQLAQEEIGAPSLDPKGIAKVREDGNAAYNAMGGIGKVTADDEVLNAVNSLNPQTGMRANADVAELQNNFKSLLSKPWDANEVVNEVRQLRKEANANQSPPALGAKPDPKKVTLGKSQMQVANALDDWLERNATAMGSPEIASAYKANRTQLAKTASVERATSGGKVDIRNLEKQDEKGVPHSGRLKIASQTGEYFPESTGAATGPDPGPAGDIFMSLLGHGRDAFVRPLISKFLQSDMYQNRLGKPVESLGPDSPLSEYFDKPPTKEYAPFSDAQPDSPLPRTQSESMLQAQKLSGDLGLEPDAVHVAQQLPAATTHPGDLTASVPPELNGLPFKASDLMDLVSELGLAPDHIPGQGIPGGQAPRAAGMAERVPDTTLHPELRSVRQTSDVGAPVEELSLEDQRRSKKLSLEHPPEIANMDHSLRLADEVAPTPEQPAPPAPPTGGGNAPTPKSGPVLPNPPVTFEDLMDALRGDVPDSTWHKLEAEGLAKGKRLTKQGMDQLGAEDVVMETPPAKIDQSKLKTVKDPVTGRATVRTLEPEAYNFADEMLGNTQNNASGESSASVEAINRVAGEKAKGQDRFKIDADGTVTPLVGVDSVDASAKKGQLIVQRGVGDTEYTILDRGGLSKEAANGRLNGARDSIEQLRKENGPGKGKTRR